MKKLKLLLIASFILFFKLSSCIAGTLTDTTDGLPSVIDLGANPEGVITITPPPNSKDFKVVAVGDINNDGYSDIIATGQMNYLSADSYNSVIYIIYGGPHIPRMINFADPALNTASLIWQYDTFPLSMSNFQTGDVNGDGMADIFFLGYQKIQIGSPDVYESKIYIIPGRKDWHGENNISDNTPGLTKVYASIPGVPYQQSKALNGDLTYGNYVIKDINGDGKADIIMSYPSTNILGVSFVGEIYIVYGQSNMPLEINAENTTCKITKVQGDTLYRNFIPGFLSIAVGDLDNDHKPDLVFDGGDNIMYERSKDYWPYQIDPTLLYGLTYTIYGQVLSAPAYTEPVLDLSKNVVGLVTLTTEAQERQASGTLFPQTWPDLTHKVFMEDINADGYDDLFLGYYSYGGIAESNTRVYIVFGQRNFLSSGKVENYRQGVLKITSAFQSMHIGNDFKSGDVNGDGFKDCLIGTQENRFYILYGRPAFPDSFQLGQNFPYGTTVTGGNFAGCGDLNNDGFQDVAGTKTDGSIFVILGKGKTYSTGETIVKPLLQSAQSQYHFSFSDSSKFHFHFTYAGPSYNSELQLTNFGNHLPDSLNSIPSSRKVISFIRAELTNMDQTYTYSVQCSIDYTDSSLAASGIKEQDLVVSTYNEQASKWEKVETTIDTTLNRATFQVGHLSLFALTDKNDSILTGVNDSYVSSIPLAFELSQNYPNPFNPVTTIKYQIPKASQVTLKIYNILGQEVKTVISEPLSAGTHEVQWDGTNNFGSKVSSGIYIYRMETNTGYVNTRKMVFLK